MPKSQETSPERTDATSQPGDLIPNEDREAIRTAIQAGDRESAESLLGYKLPDDEWQEWEDLAKEFS